MTDTPTDDPKAAAAALFQEQAQDTDKLVTALLFRIDATIPNATAAHTAGAMTALVRYFATKGSQGIGEPLHVRPIIVALTPLLHKSAERFVDAFLRGEELNG